MLRKMFCLISTLFVVLPIALIAQEAPFSGDITDPNNTKNYTRKYPTTYPIYWDNCRQPNASYVESGRGANERIPSLNGLPLKPLIVPAPYSKGTKLFIGNGDKGSWHFTNFHDNHDVCAVDFNVDNLAGNEDEGVPILSPENTTIDNVGNGGGYGHYIDLARLISTNDPNPELALIASTYPGAQIIHRFAHCMFDPAEKPGLKVKQNIGAGQVVCYQGTTGFSTGAHLHYAVYIKYTSGGVEKYSGLDYNFSEGMLSPGATITANTFPYASAISGMKHPDGTYISHTTSTVVNGTPMTVKTIYLLEKTQKRGFSSLEAYNSWAFPLSSLLNAIEPVEVDAASLALYPDGPIMSFRPGALLSSDGNLTIYQVVDEAGVIKKANITSVFDSMGYNRSWIMQVDSTLVSPLQNASFTVGTSIGGGSLVLNASCSPASVILTQGSSQQFTVTLSGGTAPFSISWSGASSGSGTSVTASFPNAGQYVVTATVVDSGSTSLGLQQTKSASCSVQVNGVVQPPTTGEFAQTSLLNDPALVSYWKLEDLSDAKGRYTLTNKGGVAFGQGKFGSGADGGNPNPGKYLSVASNLGIGSGPVTISVWFKPSSQPANNTVQSVAALQDGGSKVEYIIEYMRIGGVYRLGFSRALPGIGGLELNANGQLATGSWHHLVLTYNGTALVGYLNGSAVISGSTTGMGNAATSTEFNILARNRTSVNEFGSGMADDVAVFSRALSAQEVAQIYGGSGSSGTTPPSTPDFSFTATTNSKNVQAGNQIGFDLSLNPTSGFSSQVTVFVSGLPANVAVVNPSLTFFVGSANATNFTLTLQTAGNTPAGTYPITLTAQGGGVTKTLTVSLSVAAAPPAPLSASCYLSPNPVNLGQGTTLFAIVTGGSGGYLYSLNGGSYQSSNSNVMLPSSKGMLNYTVAVRDSSGTTTASTCSLTVN